MASLPSDERLVEATIVVGVFAAYLLLWKAQRRSQIKRTGLDPEVIHRAERGTQSYFAGLLQLLKFGGTGLIALHTFVDDAWPALARVTSMTGLHFDLAGVGVATAGLGICHLAQRQMGDAWRVGIDRQHRTPLVSQGIFGWVRNPTYLGVHLLNAGVWLVWPTTLIGAYVVLTFVVLEIQVRCEEEHLDAMLGEPYRVYCSRTKRYLPWVY